MKKIIVFLILIQLSYNGFSQNCDCSSNLNWLIETFENNDAGFQYIVDKKGETSYQNHNKTYREIASKTDEISECHKLLNDWTEYFRKFHLYVKLLKPQKNKEKVSEKEPTDKEIIEKFKNSPRFNISKRKREFYIKNLKNKKGFEGVWFSEPYTIYIIKDNDNLEREYIGFIINSKSAYWQDNQIKLEILKPDNEGKHKVKYYMRNHSSEIFDISFIGHNSLYIKNLSLLKRIQPKINTEPYIDLYFKAMDTKKPIFETISDKTVYLRIPSFVHSNKTSIDSLLKLNHKTILNSENLIIDLRSNGGGADRSYENLIPYIYTTPIRGVGVEYLSTPQNNKRMNDFIQNKEFDQEFRDWAKKSLDKLNYNLGKFVNLESEKITTKKLDTIFSNPTNVAILVNKNCGSTTEQFLLEARQSRKVKIYGTTTLGSLDISNQYSVNSPCNEFKLWYGLSKSLRIPDLTIDDIGLQPDYFLDKSIPDWEWIQYTMELMEK